MCLDCLTLVLDSALALDTVHVSDAVHLLCVPEAEDKVVLYAAAAPVVLGVVAVVVCLAYRWRINNAKGLQLGEAFRKEVGDCGYCCCCDGDSGGGGGSSLAMMVGSGVFSLPLASQQRQGTAAEGEGGGGGHNAKRVCCSCVAVVVVVAVMVVVDVMLMVV